MTSSSNQPEAMVAADFTRTWRYKVGMFLIIVGHVVLLIGLVLPFLGMGAAISGAAILGGEVTALSSIVFLGKEGFKTIKSKIFGAVKASYTTQVGRTRHYVGIALLLTNAVTTYTFGAYAWAVFAKTTAETPFPQIWGLSFEQQESMVLWLILAGEISFLVGIYVLGADWWGKFRRIFVWEEAAD